MLPIRCYLDSQDYSVLTDPKSSFSDSQRVRDRLTQLSRSGDAKFFFSAVVVSEITPLSEASCNPAELRSSLLSELCAANTLPPPDQMIKMELSALKLRQPPSHSVVEYGGYWFPKIDIEQIFEKERSSLVQHTSDALKAQPMTRSQRRATTRSISKHSKPKPAFYALLRNQSPGLFARSIIDRYPMPRRSAESIAAYMLDQGPREEAQAAFENTLNDPQWMMMWFTKDQSLAPFISEMVRAPGRKLATHLRTLVEDARVALARDALHQKFPRHTWNEICKSSILGTIEMMGRRLGFNVECVSFEDARTYCPGVTTFMQSILSSCWENVGGSRRSLPADSQPVDAMHALYAPYVDIFRADRQMAPHVQSSVEQYGTLVVSRLSKLIDTIESQIAKHS